MKAERKSTHHDTLNFVHSSDRSYGKVQRKILLPINADVDHGVAKFRNGVLTISFPKILAGTAIKKLIVVN
jgi:HSP20 family protein